MLDPSWRAAWMWRSMSPGAAPSMSTAFAVTRGRCRAAAGWSHSWVTPTTRSPAPIAKRISVALGRRETMRRGALTTPRAAPSILRAGATRAAATPSRPRRGQPRRPCSRTCHRRDRVACSSVSTVSTPKVAGTPVVACTDATPRAASPATYSKCAVSPRITAPRHTTASTPPCSASSRAAIGISKAPGTQATVTSSGAAPWRSSASRAPSSNGVEMMSL